MGTHGCSSCHIRSIINCKYFQSKTSKIIASSTLTRNSQKSFRQAFLSIVIFSIFFSPINNHNQFANCQDLSYNNKQLSSNNNNNNHHHHQENDPRAKEALDLVQEWSLQFGRDIFHGTEEATCIRSIRDQYDPELVDYHKNHDKPAIVSIDWTQTHSDIVNTISNTMSWHRNAVEDIARRAEWFAGNHTFNKNLTIDYVDVHRLRNLDEYETSPSQSFNENGSGDSSMNSDSQDNNDQSSQAANDSNGLTELTTRQPNDQFSSNDSELTVSETSPHFFQPSTLEPLPNPQELNLANEPQPQQQQPSGSTTKYLKLSRHPNFGDVPINTEHSAVHVPVHIYPGEQQIKNDIAWSEKLTEVFKNNFMINPKLTNQLYASQSGFLRLFPAQQWQVKRDDPDLYDARMRPWYVAGASSRKDVIILVDSSGSMTGSRRDIARGVALEILDTLTDNDNFLILKFSDTVQQVGVPGCPNMRTKRPNNSNKTDLQLPLKNMISQSLGASIKPIDNETDIESFYLLPANGKNVRHVRSNFSITTSGIANFSRALITAFEVLHKYQDNEYLGTPCNQAIMLITDGSPSDFTEIFELYNYKNSPRIRVFTYLIGREAGDITHTRMMACHNRGYYTHVINLAEVRETVQQYIPVMARPLVLNGSHPIVWTPAYGELTYQILTDWIWESRRREKERLKKARAESHVNAQIGSETNLDILNGGQDPNVDYEFAIDEKIEAVDLFGYNDDSSCFWQTHRNDLLTTVVEPVYDTRNESLITERFLFKNTWQTTETLMKTARLLGIAAADMKINDIIALAPSHKLGTNAYAIMLSNMGFAMHHPDLRSIMEPIDEMEPKEKMRILKPFFSSIDFTQVEHVYGQNESSDDQAFLNMRREAVHGLTGWRQFHTKRAIDCQRRPQIRQQSFYYKPLKLYPFSFILAIPQPYGSHRVEAQVQVKVNSVFPEKLSNYFTTSQYDLWTIHPDYQYCEGPSNNSITNLLDMLHRIQANKLNDIEWKPSESTQPHIFSPDKIVCDKDLIQSLVYDAIATYGFSENCSIPRSNVESSLIEIYGVKFTFVTTRSGLTRVRMFDSNDINIKKELVAFTKYHSRAVDETFYSRTVDFNMLVNQSSVVIQVPFNTHTKISDLLRQFELEKRSSGDLNFDDQQARNEALSCGDETNKSPSNNNAQINGSSSINELSLQERLKILVNRSIHMVASQAIIVNEGSQRAVAGVSGVFYDYASFVLRFYNSTNQRFQRSPNTNHNYDNEQNSHPPNNQQIICGDLSDSIDCLLLDNNGFIIVSENLDMIGRHVKHYDVQILKRLVMRNIYEEINITDYQAICLRWEEKQKVASSSLSSILTKPFKVANLISSWTTNLISIFTSIFTIASTIVQGYQLGCPVKYTPDTNKTYVYPCQKTLTLYDLKPRQSSQQAAGNNSRSPIEHFQSDCAGCSGWFVHEYVPFTNLIMIIVQQGSDTEPCQKCEKSIPISSDGVGGASQNVEPNEEQICSNIEKEFKRHKKRLDSCISHHDEESKITLCGGANKLEMAPIVSLMVAMCFIYHIVRCFQHLIGDDVNSKLTEITRV